MNKLSLEPDDHMRWIYDQRHPEYNSPRAKDLRERRAAALRSVPGWLKLAFLPEIAKKFNSST